MDESKFKPNKKVMGYTMRQKVNRHRRWLEKKAKEAEKKAQSGTV